MHVKNVGKDLMPTAWHPSRCWDWCMPKDKEKRQKNCGVMRVVHKSSIENLIKLLVHSTTI